VTVAVIRYNAGNTLSVQNALARLGVNASVTDDAEVIAGADRVIFPGVGEASTAMRHLRAHGLDRVIVGLRQPFLGICLGMQLLCTHSEENDTAGLGVFGERVRRFPDGGKVPHMGWNALETGDDTLFSSIDPGAFVYFVHGFYADIGDDTIARTHHIVGFSAALRRSNFRGVQFHPEKSASVGARILENFLS
jgi:glutamine amidotransferase